MGFRAMAAAIASNLDRSEPGRTVERRVEPRHNCRGLKIIIRDRRALGILHVGDLSTDGASGITDMPLPEGSLVFLELKKARYFGARVIWVKRLTIGLQLCRPMTQEMLDELVGRARRASGRR